jgi:hypothetical protein
MVTALARHGADYPTGQFMLEIHCRKCGDKIGLLAESPEDRAEDVRWEFIAEIVELKPTCLEGRYKSLRRCVNEGQAIDCVI